VVVQMRRSEAELEREKKSARLFSVRRGARSCLMYPLLKPEEQAQMREQKTR
jgi:hypothetical protein